MNQLHFRIGSSVTKFNLVLHKNTIQSLPKYFELICRMFQLTIYGILKDIYYFYYYYCDYGFIQCYKNT